MVTTLALRRRTLIERKALALLRGVEDAAPAPAHARRLVRLRRLAVRGGFAILPPDAPYLGIDELRLLSWIAGAQRAHVSEPAPTADPALNAAISDCAGLFDDMAMRLSSLTLCGARLCEPAVGKRNAT